MIEVWMVTSISEHVYSYVLIKIQFGSGRRSRRVYANTSRKTVTLKPREASGQTRCRTWTAVHAHTTTVRIARYNGYSVLTSPAFTDFPISPLRHVSKTSIVAS